MDDRTKQNHARWLVSILLMLSMSTAYSQLNSVGLYAGYGSDNQGNPYDFRMKPVFELGFHYNQPVFFNLSIEVDLGFNNQRIITTGSSAGYIPAEANYTYLNGDILLRYWIVNDILAFRSGKRSNSRVKAEIVQKPINFYLAGGFLNEYLLAGAGDEVQTSVVSSAFGGGIYFYMPTNNHYQGVATFIEFLYTGNLTPRFITAGEELNFSRMLVRVGLAYTFSPGRRKPFE